MTKPFAWSWTNLKNFELCPSKYLYDKTNTKYDETQPEAAYGKRVHKSFEEYLKTNNPLPDELLQFKPQLDILRAIDGDIMVESQYALTTDLEPTTWFGRDVWVRSIADFGVVNRQQGIGVTIDFKTGKRYLNWDQARLQAAVLFAREPDVNEFMIGFYWTQFRQLDSQRLYRSQLAPFWTDMRTRANKMEQMVADSKYPALQNFLCREHCGNLACKYNGKLDR